VEHGNWRVRLEDLEEIIEIMTYKGGEIPFQDPMKTLSEKVEDIWCRSEPECQEKLVIKLSAQ
jgi:hypothetical protein